MTTSPVTQGMKGAGYYDAHSEYQRRVVAEGTAAIWQMVDSLDLARVGGACTIVDYGCGTGATSAQSIGAVIRRLRERDHALPAHAIHADLVTNDFNQVFRDAAASYLRDTGGPIYLSAAAGSFFDQVTPSRTVHLGLCSNAAHWFREQPRLELAEGMYFSDASGATREELARQAADDWLRFLRARAREIVPGGRMLVQGIATITDGPGPEKVSASHLLRLMWEIAVTMVNDGLLEQPNLVSYVFPVYCRTRDEAIAPLREGGPLAQEFAPVSTEVAEVGNPYWENFERTGDAATYARDYTAFVRAFAESTLINHLFAASGDGLKLCHEFFLRFLTAVRENPAVGKYEAWILRLTMARR